MSLNPVSETLTQPTELNLLELLDILHRRKGTFLQIFLVVLAAGILAASLGKPDYVTEAKLLVPSGSPSVSIIDSNNPIAALMAAAQPDSIATQLQDLESGEFLEKANKAANVVPRADVIPPAVRFESLIDSSIIAVTVEGGDPNEIARLANAIVKMHRDDAEEKANGGIKRTQQFVEEEKKRQELKLEEAEQRLLQYQRTNKVPQRTSERDARAGEYAALLARVIETESNLNSTKAQIASLQSRLAKEPKEISEDTTRDNPQTAKFQDKISELRFQRMDLLREFRPNSRPVHDLDQQIHELQQALAAEPKEIHTRAHFANPTRAALQSRLEELTATLQGYEENHNAAVAQFQARKGLLESQDTWQAELDRLTRDRDAIQNACTMLGDRLRDLEIRSRAELVPTARIVELASPPTSPIRPRKATNIGLSAILALLLATGTVLLQEYLDDRINAPEEIERLAGLPALAHVPVMPGDHSRLLPLLPTQSPVAEAYRALRSSISFASADAPIRRLQVTSAIKGDGKTTTAANLAVAMARDGKTVILIDADLRSPSVHRLFNAAPSPGLSEVLAGMITLDEALQATEVENLLLISTGVKPPNPTELLGSAGFDRLLEQLEQRADVLLFDTPPCVPVTDPLIVAARMDAVVLVVKVGETRKGAIKQTIDLLGRARARIIGTVFNQVEPNRRGYYYYRQYHYYGEGNYYGETESGGGSAPRNGKGSKQELARARPIAATSTIDPEETA